MGGGIGYFLSDGPTTLMSSLSNKLPVKLLFVPESGLAPQGMGLRSRPLAFN